MKRGTVLALFVLRFSLAVPLLAGTSSGQSTASSFSSPSAAPLIANVAGRTAISLDGTWNSIIDPYESGLGSRFYENAKPKSKSDLIEYDFDRSPKLRVPGDWNTQRESLLFYEGAIWYQRYFSYQKKQHTRTFLYFGAANYQARVWLNGIKLGEHEGGFTPFDFEVTDKIADGENSVVVEVNNTRLADGVPGLHTDWWNYGGLTRSVQLIEVPAGFIQDYAVHLARDTRHIEGWVQLNYGAPTTGPVLLAGYITDQSVTIEIPEIHLKQTALVESGRAGFSFPAKLELWSPENPKLYHVIISGQGDSVSDDIGFRTIETRGTQILLNGKPIFLRGICLHEEAPFRSGRAFSEADDSTLLGWAKELGANFVRLAHYPHNEEMIRLADRMGILVWEEVPDYWDIDWKNPATLENAKAQLRDVIARDENRAAVAMWSMSNETPISPERTAFLKAMADYARQLDSTRLITSALNRVEHAGDIRTLNDPLAESLDVIGLNQYIGWYEGKPEDADRAQFKFAVEKPVIISEFGAGAQYGLHGDADMRFSEEYQANLFQHQIGMVQRIPELAGMTPWVLMDFRSPRRFLPGIQDYYNRKGLISDRGQKKQAFYVLQKFYQEKQQAAAH
jgi:beta-glucuronidase